MWPEALRGKRAASGGSASTQAATRGNAEQASKSSTRRPTRRNNGEGCQRPETPPEDGGERPEAGRLRRGSGGGMRARGAQEQPGKPCRWRARVHREPARASLGRQGGGEARSTGEAGSGRRREGASGREERRKGGKDHGTGASLQAPVTVRKLQRAFVVLLIEPEVPIPVTVNTVPIDREQSERSDTSTFRMPLR